VTSGEPAERRAEQIVTAVGAFARWATRTSTEMARRLPGAAAVESEYQQLERAVLAELRRRLDSVDPLDDGRSLPEPVSEASRARAAAPPPRQTEPLRVAMAELLNRSIEQTRQRAGEYLYLSILRQLLPDEARILSALADGTVYPLVHVEYRTGVTGSHRLLANASTVGRAAGVTGLRSVPRYLGRLRHLDLVQVGDADPALSVPYDICLTDDTVRAAEEEARALGRVRIVRETVRISAFGRELWDACHPRDEALDEGAVLETAPGSPLRLAAYDAQLDGMHTNGHG
jgi:hypothetical protein